jgi:2-oxoglutarate dehydrogenase E1 component
VSLRRGARSRSIPRAGPIMHGRMATALDPDLQAPSPGNLAFVEELYDRWLADPAAVAPEWQRYFARWPRPAIRPPAAPRNGAPASAPGAASEVAFRWKVERLVAAYREHGHLQARLDPLGLERVDHLHLRLEDYGLSQADLDRPLPEPEPGGAATLRELVARLDETYCRTLGVEVAHLHDREFRSWLQERMERTRNHIGLSPEAERRLLDTVSRAEIFEQFLGTRFLGAKRFSVEGAESLIALLELAIDRAVSHGVEDVTIGMAHRGRLNVLANVLGKPCRQIFAEFRDRAIIDAGGTGDVKYHLGFQTERETQDGQRVRLSLAFNPSHLEWVNTVVQGSVRARQDRGRSMDRAFGLPILVHGDAAFAGQGIVAECLQMSQLAAYTVGGTLHVVLNNQVGFTTGPRDARSTFYPTDVARMLQIPVFHVNGEDLEAVAQAVLLAVDFRQRFRSDAVIDLWCYRKHGHNEGDEPAFTQPVMVRAIAGKRSLRQLRADELVRRGVISRAEVEAREAAFRRALEEDHAASAALAVQPGIPVVEGAAARYRGGAVAGQVGPATAVPRELLERVGRSLCAVPRGFRVHPKAQKILEARAEMAEGRRPLDWGMAEALALGTLAWEGTRVRLTGQDVGRGTFSHRHAVLADAETGKAYVPLAHLHAAQAKVEVRDSLLSEAGSLGFEYGYSLEAPDALTIWEAQFGDFVNAAQVIVDQFLCSSEAKWGRLSGLALLLPHGLEGQGPEHSSARLERFLELAVDDNWFVVNLTTPAQLFHALRRQVRAPWRKPLVVMSPKSLLRLPAAASPLDALAREGFRAVLPDEAADPAEVTRVLLCSGKLYYDLAAAREAQGARHVAIVRLEQLYPLESREVLAAISRFRQGAEVVWVQEEPRNMGAHDQIQAQLAPLLGWSEFSTLSRPPSASPAAGSATRHRLEQDSLVAQAIGPNPRPRAA